MLTPRDLRGMLPGQCYYVPMVDETGGMLNDPVAVKLAEDRWWISIADSDLLLWVKAMANGYRLDVLVDEPDVSPRGGAGPPGHRVTGRAGAALGRSDWRGSSATVTLPGSFAVFFSASDISTFRGATW